MSVLSQLVRTKKVGESGSGSAPAAAVAVAPILQGPSLGHGLFEPAVRDMSQREFIAGVSHHWAPLLTRAFLHSKSTSSARSHAGAAAKESESRPL